MSTEKRAAPDEAAMVRQLARPYEADAAIEKFVASALAKGKTTFTSGDIQRGTGLARSTVRDAVRRLGLTIEEAPRGPRYAALRRNLHAAPAGGAPAGQLEYLFTTADGTLAAMDEHGMVWRMKADRPL